MSYQRNRTVIRPIRSDVIPGVQTFYGEYVRHLFAGILMPFRKPEVLIFADDAIEDFIELYEGDMAFRDAEERWLAFMGFVCEDNQRDFTKYKKDVEKKLDKMVVLRAD